MADHYTQFSFTFDINNADEKKFLQSVLDVASNYEEGGEKSELLYEAFPNWEASECVGFLCDLPDAGGQVWIRDDGGSGDVENVAAFLGAYLRKFDHKHTLSFEFAFTCSKQRADEFGGGAVVVLADDELWMNTSKWIEETLHQIKKDYI